MLSTIAAMGLSGCVRSSVIDCFDKQCPGDSLCITELGGCATPDQVRACDGAQTGAPCTSTSGQGSCQFGVCLRTECGDGRLDSSEECEPGITTNVTCSELGFYEFTSDSETIVSCTATCRFAQTDCAGRCGDEQINGPSGAELCDGSVPEQTSCFEVGADMGTVRCSPVCGFNALGCQSFGWGTEPSGTEGKLTSVHGNSDVDVYAVGTRGLILHYDGARWTKLLSPAIVDFNSVYAQSPTQVFIVGNNNGTDPVAYIGSATTGFTAIETAPSENLTSIAESRREGQNQGEGDVFIGGAAGTLLRYTGNTLEVIEDIIPATHNVAGMATNDVGQLGVVTHKGSVYIHTASQTSGNWVAHDVAASASTIGGSDDRFVIGGFSGVYQYSGTNWVRIFELQGTQVSSISFDADHTAYLANRSIADGELASSVVIMRNSQIHSFQWPGIRPNAVWATPGGDVLAVGDFGAIFRYRGVGYVRTGTPRPAIQVRVGLERTAYALSNQKQAMALGPLSWQPVVPPFVADHFDVWAEASGDVLFGTHGSNATCRKNGVVYTTPLAPSSSVENIRAVSSTDAYLVGQILDPVDGPRSLVAHLECKASGLSITDIAPNSAERFFAVVGPINSQPLVVVGKSIMSRAANGQWTKRDQPQIDSNQHFQSVWRTQSGQLLLGTKNTQGSTNNGVWRQEPDQWTRVFRTQSAAVTEFTGAGEEVFVLLSSPDLLSQVYRYDGSPRLTPVRFRGNQLISISANRFAIAANERLGSPEILVRTPAQIPTPASDQK